jgi:hypothetical protein
MIFKLLRYFFRYLSPSIMDGEGGGPVDVAPVESAPVESAPAEPTTMAEAMWNRDEAGRFAPKQPTEPATTPAANGQAAQPAPQAAQPPKPEQPEDLTALPEGLGQKAQQRFQALANGIKERDQQIEQLGAQVNYVQQQFQQHNVSQPQFEQALAVIGALNKGDFRTALAALDEQRRQIALQIGEPLPGVDALSGFPDLRQKVDGLQLSEADALELARMRQQQTALQQQQQSRQQQEQQTQQQQQAVRQAQGQVDEFCKRMAASDMDYPAIEKLLLPKIQRLVQGVPPSQWAGLIQTQYELIKESGAAFRGGAPTAPAALRPMGTGGGKPAPASMFDAMWNR